MTYIEPKGYSAVKFDAVGEYTTDAGVTVEGVLCKDGETDGVDLAVWTDRTASKSGGTGPLGTTMAWDVYTGSVVIGNGSYAVDVTLPSHVDIASVNGVVKLGNGGTYEWRTCPDGIYGIGVSVGNDDTLYLSWIPAMILGNGYDSMSYYIEMLRTVSS